MKTPKIIALALVAVLLTVSANAFAKGKADLSGRAGNGGKPCKWVVIAVDPVTGSTTSACVFRGPHA
jgi:hypothetical protein